MVLPVVRSGLVVVGVGGFAIHHALHHAGDLSLPRTFPGKCFGSDIILRLAQISNCQAISRDNSPSPTDMATGDRDEKCPICFSLSVRLQEEFPFRSRHRQAKAYRTLIPYLCLHRSELPQKNAFPKRVIRIKVELIFPVIDAVPLTSGTTASYSPNIRQLGHFDSHRAANNALDRNLLVQAPTHL